MSQYFYNQLLICTPAFEGLPEAKNTLKTTVKIALRLRWERIQRGAKSGVVSKVLLLWTSVHDLQVDFPLHGYLKRVRAIHLACHGNERKHFEIRVHLLSEWWHDCTRTPCVSCVLPRLGALCMKTWRLLLVERCAWRLCIIAILHVLKTAWCCVEYCWRLHGIKPISGIFYAEE